VSADVERIVAELTRLAETWEREAEPYLVGGHRYEKASATLRARAETRDLDAMRLRDCLSFAALSATEEPPC
jgi:hypothetical protein